MMNALKLVVLPCPEVAPRFWSCISQSQFHFTFLIVGIDLNSFLQINVFTVFKKCQNMMKVLISSVVPTSNMEHRPCSSRLSVSIRVLVNSTNNFFLPLSLCHPVTALIGH